MNAEPAPLSSRRARVIVTGAALAVLSAGHLVRPAAPSAANAMDERPAPILQEAVSRREAGTMVRRLQEVASEHRRFSARFVAAPRPLERWSDWSDPPAPEGERYGLVVDARRLLGRVGDLPEGTQVDVFLGDGRQLRGTVAARVAAQPLGIVEVDTSVPLRTPEAAGAAAPGDAAVATAPGASGPIVAPLFVAGMRDGAVLLTGQVDRLDGMPVFTADGALVGVIATGASGTKVLPVEAALRPPEPTRPPRALLGVTLTFREAQDTGGLVVVNEVAAGGAAARGGLREGDVLLDVDGQPVETLDAAVARLSADAPVTRVRVRRGRRTLERTLDRTPPAMQP